MIKPVVSSACRPNLGNITQVRCKPLDNTIIICVYNDDVRTVETDAQRIIKLVIAGSARTNLRYITQVRC